MRLVWHFRVFKIDRNRLLFFLVDLRLMQSFVDSSVGAFKHAIYFEILYTTEILDDNLILASFPIRNMSDSLAVAFIAYNKKL